MKEYAEKVSAIVAEELGKETEVLDVNKANMSGLIAVCVKDGALGANYYVNGYYEDGVDVETCAKLIVETHKECGDGPEGLDLRNLDMSWNNVKDKLTARLINADRNKEYLEDVVSRYVGCGLAIIADINMTSKYRAVVTSTLAEKEKYDIGELIDTAINNSASKTKACMRTLEDAMFGSDNNVLGQSGADANQTYVLTNESMTDGACAMFYPNVMEQIKTAVGNFYALPSSIHEFIIIPASAWSGNERDLAQMVALANETVVSPQDVLSDNVYYYDGDIKVVA